MKNLPKEVIQALNILNSHNYEAYVVGGAVRNILLGLDVNDYDITTNARPNTIKLLFGDYQMYNIGEKHGTIVVQIGKYKLDITTFRQDNDYLDHRHPKSVDFSDDLYEDVKRRDFTINAMCLDKEEKLYDFFNGIKDLENKTIRAIGCPKTRFSEDALRILRAIKFKARLNFEIEEKTNRALFECKDLLNYVANERKKEELLQCLSKDSYSIINDYLEIFTTFIPFVEVDKRISNFKNPYYSLSYALSKTNNYNLKDLKFSNNEINLINKLIASTGIDINNDIELIKVLSCAYDKEIKLYLESLHQIKLDERINNLKDYIVEINNIDIKGNELKTYGYETVKIGEIKKELLHAIHNKHIKNNKIEILQYLSKRTTKN